MAVAVLRIRNFKSFYDSGEIRFSERFTVIVGQNNAGKTALMEALSLQRGSVPHRSVRTMPTPGTLVDSESVITVTFIVNASELKSALKILGAKTFIADSNLSARKRLIALMADDSTQRSVEIVAEYRPAMTFGTVDSRYLGQGA